MIERTEILVTGATGFVGSAVMKALAGHDLIDCTGAVRSSRGITKCYGHQVIVGELNQSTDWTTALAGKHIVIHTAARAHVIKDVITDPLAEYRRVNVEGTLNLARQAATSGVKRFVFLSSIKVNGETTTDEQVFFADAEPTPEDFYGLSKLEAERGLMRLSTETDMEVVIIRPPLVYGPGVKGNFASMIKLVDKRVPLPLGAIHNKRSLVGIDNLVDLIIRCLDHPAAANQVFLAGDGEDLSTTELLRGVGQAMGNPARLIPVPAGLLQFGAMLLGKEAMAQRLLGSLQVDISKTCEVLGWKPPYTVEEGLKRCFERSN